MTRMTTVRMAEIREKMQQIRRENLWKVVLVALLGCVALVAGIMLRAWIQAGGHPRLSNFVMAMFVLGAFALFIWAGMLHSKANQAMLMLIKDDIETIRREFVMPVEQRISMNVDDMLLRSIPNMQRRIVWNEQVRYRDVPVAVSKVHLWLGHGENGRRVNYIVLTLPVVEGKVQMHHTWGFDLLKGRNTWSMGPDDEAFREIITEEWSMDMNCAAIETRRLNGQRVVDIALKKVRLFEFRRKLNDPVVYLEWYRQEMSRMCEMLDKAMTLSIIKRE